METLFYCPKCTGHSMIGDHPNICPGFELICTHCGMIYMIAYETVHNPDDFPDEQHETEKE